MKRASLAVFIAVLGIAGLAGLSRAAFADKPTARKAPDFAYTDLKGQKYSLNSLRGKVILVDLWATWCPPCRKDIPQYVKFQKKYPDKMIIIGVSYDDSQDDLKEFIKENEVGRQINYPIVFGPPEPPFFGDPSTLPQAFIIDKKGNIRMEHLGFFPPEELEPMLEKLLAEPE